MTKSKIGSANERLMVGLANSRRLAAMREKAGFVVNKSGMEASDPINYVDGLNQQGKEALRQAWTVVEKSMAGIINTYPAGKKETFFKLKYGVSSDKIKTMSMKQVFALLKLDSSVVKNFKLIAHLDSRGQSSRSD